MTIKSETKTEHLTRGMTQEWPPDQRHWYSKET